LYTLNAFNRGTACGREKIAAVQPPPEFSVTRRRAGDAIVVIPVGEIDLATVDQLQAELDAAAGEATQVVLDLREVSFIDSAGLRLVLYSSRALEASGGGLTVVRGPREVQRVFDLVGLDGRLAMLDLPPDE
jgi:anti-anti-sigma factor